VCSDICTANAKPDQRHTFFGTVILKNEICHLWEIRGVRGLLRILDVENLVAQFQRHTSINVPLSLA